MISFNNWFIFSLIAYSTYTGARSLEILVAMFCLMWVAPPHRACSITTFLTLITFRELLAATCSLCWRQRRRCAVAIKSRILGTNSGQENSGAATTKIFQPAGEKDINSPTVWVFFEDFIGIFPGIMVLTCSNIFAKTFDISPQLCFSIALDLYLWKRFR